MQVVLSFRTGMYHGAATRKENNVLGEKWAKNLARCIL